MYLSAFDSGRWVMVQLWRPKLAIFWNLPASVLGNLFHSHDADLIEPDRSIAPLGLGGHHTREAIFGATITGVVDPPRHVGREVVMTRAITGARIARRLRGSRPGGARTERQRQSPRSASRRALCPHLTLARSPPQGPPAPADFGPSNMLRRPNPRIRRQFAPPTGDCGTES